MAARSNTKAGNTPSTGTRKAAKTKPSPATPQSSSSPPAKSDVTSRSPLRPGCESKPATPNLFSYGPQPVNDFSGLFDLYEEPDGCFRAELGRKTAPFFRQLSWKLKESEAALSYALMLLTGGIHELTLPEIPAPIQLVPFGRSNIYQIHAAATKVAAFADFYRDLIKKLHAAIGEDYTSLADEETPSAARQKAKKRLKSQFSHVLEALEKKSSRKAHSGTSQVGAEMSDGTKQDMPLAWIILVNAREYVAKTQKIPTKRDLRKRIESLYFDAKAFSAAQWAASFKEAGLADLERADNW